MNSFRFGLALMLCATIGCSRQNSETITGAGSTFFNPICTRWAFDYSRLTGVRVNYESTGSSAGITQAKEGTVNFGASDAPLTEKELTEARLVQFPIIIGGIVPVVHLEGVKAGQLKLSPEVFARIYLGEIKNWNDPAIHELNADVELPDMQITPVRRADGSGTTWIFTQYLATVSPDWKEKVGAGKEVAWPTGIGGKGNEGVSGSVKQIDGSIGYVEYAYAVQNKMTYAQLRNKAGKFVEPTLESFRAAAANADWAGATQYYVVLVDQPGDESWPITGASFILMKNDQSDPHVARGMLKFFDWCLHHGADAAKELHYVPLPSSVYELVETTWDKDVRSQGKPVER